ncbi:ribosomal L1 domain-containing protein 1 [Dunckerocampus dactyliophorus]|uniref:ribosomal L1 domain-containing protein 1 n=1 Tax=Dunckerocampus dactyliophorus TaxID=161453 RepID=UPI0024057FB0|nr:ribosomal L1 domain-containing protein 1 [Dunckerocampus dactyliophorus]
MDQKTQVELDRSQVKKAVLALQAFLKSKSGGESLFRDESQKISLLFTFWRIPRWPQTIRIPLPHGERTDTEEVCLFTRDEPRMTTEQTQRFYRRLLEESGVKNVTEIIPYNVLKTEYKPFEAKRRLLGNFDLFLSDNRIRRLLPSHLGKHFYKRKKEPLSVNLQSKHLARTLQSTIQGTSAKVTNNGPCCMVRVGHAGMAADELMENITVVVQAVMEKLREGPAMKIIHLKSERSVALPIYTSDLTHLTEPRAAKVKKRKVKAKAAAGTKATEDTKQTAGGEQQKRKKRKVEKDEDEEEIPQLVPMETGRKKPKLQSKKKKTTKPGAKKQAAKRGGKTKPKGKGRVPKVK